MEQVFEAIGFSWIAYLALYFGGMVIASVYDIIKEKRNPNFISIGASGAVSAVLFTSIFFNPWGKILFLLFCQFLALSLDLFILLIASIWLNKLEII